MKLDLLFFDNNHILIENFVYNIKKSDTNIEIYKKDELIFSIQNRIENRNHIIKIIWTNIIKQHICELHDKNPDLIDIIMAVYVYNINNIRLLFESVHLTYDECINHYEFPYSKSNQLFDVIYLACHHDIS